jgi:heme exporter protein D
VKLDAGTFLVQWAAGGLLFGWITTRRREVSLGYGWLVRITFGLMAFAGGALVFANDHERVPTAAFFTGAAAFVALASSVTRRRAGVRGREALRAERRARVAAMVGRGTEADASEHGPEFDPRLDLVAAALGLIAVLLCAQISGGPYVQTASRLIVGAAFLGSVTDAMLLGHWYLVQPGLRRDAVKELVVWTAGVWPFEIAVFLWPTGMVQVFNGAIDDGYSGLLAYVWLACALTTIVMVALTWFALRERYYSAVMAATGLLYLAILTAFGTDLVARAVLRP